MNPTPKRRSAPRANARNEVTRRDFLAGGIAAGVVVGGGMGAFTFGYGKAEGNPIRVGVIGAGDQGNVLIGAINPDYLQVKAIADIRPYNIHRAFHGDYYSEAALAVRCGLLTKYGWKTEHEARRHVRVYSDYRDLLIREKNRLDAVIIALPLHLHAPVAIAAMQAGLHVLTEKLMAHGVHECKEMTRVAHETGLYLATGHQRHYNILYAEAMDTIERGVLGELHYIRAQWHRGNLPGHDSWQQPLPPEVKPKDPMAQNLIKKLRSWKGRLAKASGREIELWQKRVNQVRAQLEDKILNEKGRDGKPLAESFGYRPVAIKNSRGGLVYEGPAIEELIRWRLWDRTGGGLMVELGSHQLDAAGLFISAMHDGRKQHPISVVAAANRPVFPPDRDADDHVCCIIEFPAPGYDPKSAIDCRKKIGVQYASINGNGFGGYGEIVFGTKGTLVLEREKETTLFRGPSSSKVTVERNVGPTMDTQASGPAQLADDSGPDRVVSRGYTEEMEHWAWCIRNPDPENQPRCRPEVALADAVIALTTNIAARQGRRIEFKPEWFDPDSDETPEGIKPDVGRYG
jgi:predicted dehydrogenase